MVQFQKVIQNFFSPYAAQLTLSAAENVQASLALPAVRLSCLLRCRGTSIQDGAAAKGGILSAPF
jgi:hypothetical protein